MKPVNVMEMLWRAWVTDHGPRLVQVITITINGVPHMCFAPVIQEAFQEDGQVDISLIELGDAIEVQQAVELMEGKYLQGRVVN
jgi:hypothetical protein